MEGYIFKKFFTIKKKMGWNSCFHARDDLPRAHCDETDFRQYNTSSFSIRNFKSLPSFCGCAGRFESTLVLNPEDRFSRDGADIWPSTCMSTFWGFLFRFTAFSLCVRRDVIFDRGTHRGPSHWLISCIHDSN